MGCLTCNNGGINIQGKPVQLNPKLPDKPFQLGNNAIVFGKQKIITK